MTWFVYDVRTCSLFLSHTHFNLSIVNVSFMFVTIELSWLCEWYTLVFRNIYLHVLFAFDMYEWVRRFFCKDIFDIIWVNPTIAIKTCKQNLISISILPLNTRWLSKFDYQSKSCFFVFIRYLFIIACLYSIPCY